MPKTITINLNNSKATIFKRDDFVYEDELDKVLKLISDRIEDIKSSKNKHYSYKKEYNLSRMHDAILIDGKRGTGKSTFLLNLEADINRKEKDNKISAKVLDTIDPNQLDEKSNILLIIIAHIYTELLEYMQGSINSKNDQREKFKKLTNQIHSLTSAISTSQERAYEDDYDKLYNLHKSLIIDEDLHHFFSEICDFFEVDVLILPIDDIDMDFIHGYKVIDSIRKYLSTPRIIPIISLDTTQIYALVKQKNYEYFGYKAYTPKRKITPDSELTFLRKLPEDYLQKILMPTRKIVLPDIYELYKMHLKKIHIQFSFNTNISENKTLKFNINMTNIIKYYMNIIYDYTGDINNIDNYRIINYLKDKSFRSFYEDLTAFLRGVRMDNNNIYFYDTRDIKDRLVPFYIDHFDNRYDATDWFWDKYLNELKIKIVDYINEHKDKDHRYINSFYIDISREILLLNSFGEASFIRDEQTYIRLYLQDFFIKNIEIKNIEIKNNKEVNSLNQIEKEIDITGLIELVTRTLIPMYLFEELINEEIIDIFKYNIKELSFFARDNNDSLKDTMFDLSISILKYYNDNTFSKVEENTNKKIIGIFLKQENYELSLKYPLFIERYSDLKLDKDIYFLSPLKYYSMIPYYFNCIKGENKNNCLDNLKRDYQDIFDEIHLNPIFNKNDIFIKMLNSNIGILKLADFAKNLVKNVLKVSIQDYDIEFTNKLNISSNNIKFELFIHKNINTYKSIYFHHFLIFLIQSLKNQELNKKLKINNITTGTKAKDFEKYKIKENFFIENIKTVLKYLKEEINNYENGNENLDSYKSIENFLYKLYLSLVKHYTYQSSFYIIEDKEFNIQNYIIRYYMEKDSITQEKAIKEIEQNSKDKKNKFYELAQLYSNIGLLYKEGNILNSSLKYLPHNNIKLINFKNCIKLKELKWSTHLINYNKLIKDFKNKKIDIKLIYKIAKKIKDKKYGIN